MNEVKNKTSIKWLKEWAKPYQARYFFSILCALLGVASSILPYFAISQIVIALLSGYQEFPFYLTWTALCVVFWIFRIVFHSVSTALSHQATFSVIADVRKKMLDKLTRLPMGQILDTPSGEFKNLIVEKVDSIEPTLAHILPEMTANIMVPILIIIYIVTLDWRMALIALITLPIGLFCFMGMMVGYEGKFANYVQKNKQLNATAVEYINGIEVIKAFNQSAASYEKFTTAATEAATSAINWMKDSQLYFCLALSILPATLVTILPFGGWFYLNGSLSMNHFVQIIILSIGIMPPLVTAFSYSDDLGKINTVVQDLAHVLGSRELERPVQSVDITNYRIVLEQVSFRYDQKAVLEAVDLTINPHSVTALVGPSGSGKSTITKLIASLWDVSGGSIQIGGVDVRDIPLEQLNQMIAYVAQDNYLFNDTVRNNIRIGCPTASDLEVEQAAQASGCHDFIMQLEHGYETVAGGAGGHLSGGERQRISIARAMLKNAPIIILDEATAYTDPENEALIQNAVSKLVTDKTLIVVAHRLSTIIDSDQIVVVQKGAIHQKGTHQELLQHCALYQEMWNAHIDAKDSTEEAIC